MVIIACEKPVKFVYDSVKPLPGIDGSGDGGNQENVINGKDEMSDAEGLVPFI